MTELTETESMPGGEKSPRKEPPPGAPRAAALGDGAAIERFVTYLWGSAAPPTLLYRTSGYAVRRPPASPPETPTSGTALPFGSIHLYPDYLAFVSDPGSAAPPAPLRHSLSRLTPMPLGSAAYSRLPAAERTRLARPLRGKGSILLPLGEARGVEAAIRDGQPCIEVLTAGGVVRLGPHPDAARSGWAIGSTRWEPRLGELLAETLAMRRKRPPT